MAITYQPKNVLKRMASKKAVKKLLTNNLTVNKAALNALENSGLVGKKQLEKIAIKVLREYKERIEERPEGVTKREAVSELKADPLLMVQRVQNATVNEITKSIKRQYRGEYYVWLPSTAAQPDEKHMKKYGKRYQLGRGEQPGDRYGCQCGMKILVNETRLTLDEE